MGIEFIPDDPMYRGTEEAVCGNCGNPVAHKVVDKNGNCPICHFELLRETLNIRMSVDFVSDDGSTIKISTPHGRLTIAFGDETLDDIVIYLDPPGHIDMTRDVLLESEYDCFWIRRNQEDTWVITEENDGKNETASD